MKKVLAGLILGMFLFSAVAYAAMPKYISVQGRLSDADGPVSGAYDFDFKISDQSSCPNPPLWEEVRNNVNLDNGVFNVLIGTNTPINDNFNGARYLCIGVKNDEADYDWFSGVPVSANGYAYAADNFNIEGYTTLKKDASFPNQNTGIGFGATDAGSNVLYKFHNLGGIFKIYEASAQKIIYTMDKDGHITVGGGAGGTNGIGITLPSDSSDTAKIITEQLSNSRTKLVFYISDDTTDSAAYRDSFVFRAYDHAAGTKDIVDISWNGIQYTDPTAGNTFRLGNYYNDGTANSGWLYLTNGEQTYSNLAAGGLYAATTLRAGYLGACDATTGKLYTAADGKIMCGTDQTGGGVTDVWVNTAGDTMTNDLIINSGGGLRVGTTGDVGAGTIAATGWIGAGCESNCDTGGGYALMYADGIVQTTGDIKTNKGIRAGGHTDVADGDVVASGSVTAGANMLADMWCDGTYDICINPLNSGWLHIRNKANDAYKGIAAQALYLGYNSQYIDSGTVWTSANDGSGSGLDADLLDNKKIQAGTINWGTADTNDDGYVTITFPEAFSGTPVLMADATGGIWSVGVTSVSSTGATIYCTYRLPTSPVTYQMLCNDYSVVVSWFGMG